MGFVFRLAVPALLSLALALHHFFLFVAFASVVLALVRSLRQAQIQKPCSVCVPSRSLTLISISTAKDF
jgi:hypothetical protein